jgi:hypothetical protein
MTKFIDNLLKNSGLPGPRGNLELLHSFSKMASPAEIEECFLYYTDDLSNSPEEFVVMCGVVGHCILNKSHINKTIGTIKKYASHSSWRIREAVAIGIQEMAGNNLDEILQNLKKWISGNDYEKRAVVAALCEPKLLKDKIIITEVIELLHKITNDFSNINGKLTDSQKTLQKSLGYGWSVAIVSLPNEGKKAFEMLTKSDNKNIKWIVKENLKKKRLSIIDKIWVEKMLATIA